MRIGEDIRLRAAVVFLAALVTFAGTLGFGLVWDDPILIDRVKADLAAGEAGKLFTTAFYVSTQQSARYFRPVMMGSLLGDVILAGGVPWFSHMVNILIHAFNAVLVFLLLKRILRHDTGAFAGALLFAIHPVHAGAVGFVSGRMDLLALLLLLPPALYWADGGSAWRSGTYRNGLLVLLSFVLACLAKETAFMLPVILLCWQLLGSEGRGKKGLSGLVPLALAAGMVVLVRAMLFAREAGTVRLPGVQAGAILPDISPVKILEVLLVNMRLAVMPFPHRSHWMGGDLFPGWPTVLAALGFLLLLILAFRYSAGSAARGLLWWAVFTVPVLGFFNLGHTVAAERYAYIPSVGVCLIIGGLVSSLPDPVVRSRWYRGLAGMTALFLLAGTTVHARVWRGEVTLFQHIVQTNPSYGDGYVNLGVALAGKGFYAEALKAYDDAEVILPKGSMAAFNRGNLLYRLGRYEEALADFDVVLEKDPGDWEASLNRGNALAELGRTEDAALSYENSMAHCGSSGKPLVGLALLAARAGRFEEAARLFGEAASREPTLFEAFEGLAESYLALGMPGPAEKAFLRAIEVSGGDAGAAVKLGELLLNTNRPVQAIQAFRTSLALDSSSLPAWVGFIRASRAAGKGSEAESYLRHVERNDPVLAGKIRRATGTRSP